MARTERLTPSQIGGGQKRTEAQASAAAALPPGLLASYRPEEVLGAGAMGVVYRATHLALQRPVAIKLTVLDAQEHEERFVREGRLLSRLQHPNLVRVYDAGKSDGTPYLVMELVKGCTLATLAAGRALPSDLAVGLVVQLLDGLAHAHEAGVLHRDVKTENALVTVAGLLKLADFGLARSELEATKTRAGTIMGTPAYMSPEQARGARVDARSDLYSAAVVLFELAAGRLPFVSESPVELITMQLRDAPPSLLQVARAVPKPVADAVSRALSKDPADRFATVGELAACLREAVGEERLEKAGSRLGKLVSRAGEGAQVVAGTTFLREMPGPEMQTGSARTRAARRDATRRPSGRAPTASGPTVRTATRVKPVRSRSRTVVGLALVLGVLVVTAVAASLSSGSRSGSGEVRRPRQVEPAKAAEVSLVLHRAGTGSLRFVTRPPGAQILGQGGSDTHMVTPAVLDGLLPGRWRFTLELEAHMPATVSTEVVAGVTGTVDVALARALEPQGTNAAGFEEYRNLKDGSVLIRIPGGSFEMGSNDGQPDEKPVHRVTLSAYYFGKHEVTWKQYREFCRQARRPLPGQLVLGTAETPDDHPVNYVTWNDAKAYCDWAGLRLPTEAEWEYAARGPRGREYPWGDELPDAGARYRANGIGGEDGFVRTAPVGSFGPGAKPPRADGSSPFGALDLAGNVWEWCADWHGDYPAKAIVDPRGPDHGRHRVLRGGSFDYVASYLRAYARNVRTPLDVNDSYGFRCVR